MATDFFRKKALDKISSHEQLDRMIVITSPKGWFALLAVGLIILVALLWGIYGTINYRTIGWGIVLSTGGIYTVEAPAGGRVASLSLEIDDYVRKGQLVGRIEQPKTLHEIKHSIDRAEELTTQFKQIKELDEADIKNKLTYLEDQEKNTKETIADLTGHNEWLGKMLKGFSGLREEGGMSEVEYHKNKREYDETAIKIDQTKEKLLDIQYEKLNTLSTIKKQHFLKQFEIDDEKNKRRLLMENLSYDSEIVSKYSGTVLEILVNKGEIVNASDGIVKLADEKNRLLEAVVYFNALDGKKVRPGMRINVTPTVVKSEKFGSIIGIVTSVAKQPSSKKAIIARLQNPMLVDMITGKGAPFVATVKLLLDPRTTSGYQWTSSNGPPFTIKSGTVCIGSVVTRKEPPINLLFQMGKKYLLGIGDAQDREEKSIQEN